MGETTIERLGKRTRMRNSLIDTPKRKYQIELSLLEEEIQREQRSRLGNFWDMLTNTHVLNQKEMMQESKLLHEKKYGQS